MSRAFYLSIPIALRQDVLSNVFTHVIETAATVVREPGIDGLGIADLVEAAGLTHGGSYGQFQSQR